MRVTTPPAFNTTRLVLGLIAVNAAVHGLRLLLPANWSMEILTVAGFSPPWFLAAASGMETVYLPFLLLSPITYAFLHADIAHLLINMAFLLAFGTAIDQRIGGRRFLAFYLICTLCAAAASTVLFLFSRELVLIVGASGAVSGLFGAVLRFRLRRRLVAIVVFIVINIILGYTGFSSFGEVRAIAWDAHIGGFLGGYLLFPLFDRRPRSNWPPGNPGRGP
ncbi:MAG: rhomboid family intramembrane serine protease [Alphaproteobacteria bacterium]|nr:rhomboid family intramembrane serine protease [Alphaproteobacteria bacterium]